MSRPWLLGDNGQLRIRDRAQDNGQEVIMRASNGRVTVVSGFETRAGIFRNLWLWHDLLPSTPAWTGRLAPLANWLAFLHIQINTRSPSYFLNHSCLFRSTLCVRWALSCAVVSDLPGTAHPEDTLTRCSFTAGSPSATLDQH